MIEIGGGQHAVDLPGRLDQQVLRGRRLAAPPRSGPCRTGPPTRSCPASSVLASEPASIHGLRCSGVAMTAPSLTIAIGLASWSTTTSALAWARSAPPDRLGQRQRWTGPGSPAWPACGPAGRAAAPVSSPSASAWPALIHMKPPTATSHRPYGPAMPKLLAARRPEQGTSTSAMVRTRPAQAASTVAVADSCRSSSRAGPQHPAAVQRQTRQQVEDADQQVREHEPVEITCMEAVPE